MSVMMLGLDILVRVGFSFSVQEGKWNVSFGEGRVAEATRCSGEASLGQPTIWDPDYEATFRGEVGGEMETER